MLCRKCGTSVDERSRNCPNCGAELNTGQVEEFASPESPRSQSLVEVRKRLGQQAQIGGGIALLIGGLTYTPLLYLAGESRSTFAFPLALIMIGLFLFLAGTITRLYYRN
ncbi:MAG: zinc-ribbon domain-containing protein [Terriglobia bacterium]|jgi:hypothetical protein